jgi:MFS family permease
MRGKGTWAAYLLLGLFAFMETAVGPAMPFIRERLDLGYTMASLHFFAFASGAIVVGLTGERWMRLVGRPRALWGGLAGMVAGALLLAFSPVVAGTVLGTLIMGSLGTCSLMANQAVLADLHGEQRAIALTESNVAATSMAILAPLVIGAAAASRFGWQMGIIITVPWFAALWLVYGRVALPPVREAATQQVREMRLPAAFWWLAMVLFLVSAVEWCLAYWGAEFLATVVGLGSATAATAMSIFFIAMAAGRILGSRLVRRYQSVPLLLIAVVIALVGFLGFWLAAQPVVSLTGLFIAGFGVANFYPLTVAVATGAAPDLIDRATARLAVATGLALLTAPLAVGTLADVAGMRWGFGIVVPLLVAAFASILVARHLLAALPGAGVSVPATT